ncbi:hypothetical protein RINTHM_12920 [Richelia intracellularis HM01]|nr:hypothetical protein RINTHM_12920 [Richelia intracellularis HM01]
MAAIPLQPDMISFGLNSLKVIQYWDEAAKLRAAFIMDLDFFYI